MYGILSVDYFQEKRTNSSTEEKTMEICYNRLWKLLREKGMVKQDLRMAAGLSTNVIANMGKRKDVSTGVLRKICDALDCDLSDIVEFVKDGD